MSNLNNMSDEEIIMEIINCPRNILDIAYKRLKSIKHDEVMIQEGKLYMIRYFESFIDKLIKDHRFYELEKAAENPAYLEKLLIEYDMFFKLD